MDVDDVETARIAGRVAQGPCRVDALDVAVRRPLRGRKVRAHFDAGNLGVAGGVHDDLDPPRRQRLGQLGNHELGPSVPFGRHGQKWRRDERDPQRHRPSVEDSTERTMCIQLRTGRAGGRQVGR